MTYGVTTVWTCEGCGLVKQFEVYYPEPPDRWRRFDFNRGPYGLLLCPGCQSTVLGALPLKPEEGQK